MALTQVVAPEWPETIKTPDGHYYTRDDAGFVQVHEVHLQFLLANGYKLPGPGVVAIPTSVPVANPTYAPVYEIPVKDLIS